LPSDLLCLSLPNISNEVGVVFPESRYSLGPYENKKHIERTIPKEDDPFDLSLILLFMNFLFVMRMVFHKILSKYLSKLDLKENEKRNLISSIFYMSAIISSVLFGEYVTFQESWKSNLDDTFVGWPHVASNNLNLYYNYCICFYMNQLLIHCTEKRKKDFWLMIVHHLITITLIGASGFGKMQRIGTVIMLRFDPCDILLEAAKILSKMKFKVTSVACFFLFVVLWVVNRLWWYPTKILLSAWKAEVLAGQEIPWLRFCVFCLFLIFILQIYWTYFILKKLVSFYQNGMNDTEDPREELDQKQQA